MVVVIDVCVCGGGGCTYGVAVVGNHSSNLHCVVVFFGGGGFLVVMVYVC